MKNKSSQKGAISIFVMVAMLFFMITVLGVYSISSKRAQTQKDSFSTTKQKFYSENMTDIYEQKITENTGKIFNKEQLWNIEADETYTLQNDIVINISELKNSNINYLKAIATINYGDYDIYYYHNNEYYVLNKYNNGSTTEYTRAGNLTDILYASGENFDAISTTLPSGTKYYSFAYKNLSEDLGYVTEGLVLHYDGIKNTATGHSNTATTWKDLSGHGKNGNIYGINNTAESGWHNSYIALDGVDHYVANSNITVDGANGTVEIIGKFYSGSYIFRSRASGNRTYIKGSYTTKGSPGVDCYFYTTNYNDLASRVLKWYSADDKEYEVNYYNNNKSNEVEFTTTTNGTYIAIGSFMPNSAEQLAKVDVYAVRVYNRALTTQEIARNYAIDRARFGIE